MHKIHLRPRLTYANVIATLCLFIVLGGDSVAQDAVSAAKKLVTGKQIKNSTITGKDVRNGSLEGADVKDGSLGAADLAPGTLTQGPRGEQGPQGERGPAGPPGSDTDFDGAAAGGALTGTYPDPAIADDAVRTGSILDGTIGADDIAGDLFDAAPGIASLRSLGTGAAQAAAGDDPRLSDTRVPTDGSVDTGKFASGAKAPNAELLDGYDAQLFRLRCPSVLGWEIVSIGDVCISKSPDYFSATYTSAESYCRTIFSGGRVARLSELIRMKQMGLAPLHVGEWTSDPAGDSQMIYINADSATDPDGVRATSATGTAQRCVYPLVTGIGSGRPALGSAGP